MIYYLIIVITSCDSPLGIGNTIFDIIIVKKIFLVVHTKYYHCKL